MIPPTFAVVLAVAASLSHHAVPDRAPHAVVQQAPRPSGTALRGVATWYAYRSGEAAAGPALRAFLGKGWRGQTVEVCASGHCVLARLTDWCACGHGRAIDLDRRLFAQLASPSVGVLRVTVR